MDPGWVSGHRPENRVWAKARATGGHSAGGPERAASVENAWNRKYSNWVLWGGDELRKHRWGGSASHQAQDRDPSWGPGTEDTAGRVGAWCPGPQPGSTGPQRLSSRSRGWREARGPCEGGLQRGQGPSGPGGARTGLGALAHGVPGCCTQLRPAPRALPAAYRARSGHTRTPGSPRGGWGPRAPAAAAQPYGSGGRAGGRGLAGR